MDTSTSAPTSFDDADQIPGYRIVRFLAQGGMGSVYLAEDENLKRLVAIKVINTDLKDNPDFKRRFTDEAVIIAAFQHANIITVFASGWLGEKPYFVMEYVGGGTLGHRLDTGRLADEAAYRIGFQMADALAYSHERNVIHRDFKPNNILLRENGTPVLSDFGIAKSAMRTGTQTQVGAVIGSARYMAPEQARGEVISNRVDIYSFGLVLHQMLLGDLPARHPIRTREDERLLARTMRSASPECLDLVRRCLQAAPDARPTAAQCRDALGALSKRSAGQRLKESLLPIIGGVACAGAIGVGVWQLGLLGHHGAVQAQPHLSAGAPQADMVSLAIQRSPSSAKVFIDDHQIAKAAASVAAGQHDLVAVASGFYGHVEHVAWSRNNEVTRVDLTLEPTVLPDRDEMQHFLKLTESQTLTSADVQSIKERTLHEALFAQRLSQTDRLSELESLSRDVDTLRRFGDSRAAVAALLIDSMRAGRPSRGLITQSLIDASANGDPMASMFMAMAYRESLNVSDRPIATTDPLYQSYCQYLARAISQGWTAVASEYLGRDRCAN